MQKNFAEQCVEMSKCCYIEPMMALNDLNTKTLNKLAKSNNVHDFLNARKAEDVLEAQRKFMSEINSLTMDYVQQLSNLVLECSAHMTQHFNTIVSETSRMGSEAIKSTTTTGSKGTTTDKK